MCRSRGLRDGCGMQRAQQRDGAARARGRRAGWRVVGWGMLSLRAGCWSQVVFVGFGVGPRFGGRAQPRLHHADLTKAVPASAQGGPRASNSPRASNNPQVLPTRPLLHPRVRLAASLAPARPRGSPSDANLAVRPAIAAYTANSACYMPPRIPAPCRRTASHHESPVRRKEHRPKADPQRRHLECTSCRPPSSRNRWGPC